MQEMITPVRRVNPDGLDGCREELTGLLIEETRTLNYVLEGEKAGLLRVSKDSRAPHRVSRSLARRLAKLLEMLGVFVYVPGIGRKFTGMSCWWIILGADHEYDPEGR